MAKSDIYTFDYKVTARLDTDMWQAYYNHKFFRLFILALKLMRTQLNLSWFMTIKVSYHAAWAAADYRLNNGKEKYERTLKNLVKMYKIVSVNCTTPFDYKRAAELELEWWNIHRYPERYKKSLEDSLADGMKVIYSIKDSEELRSYARNRAEAMLLPRHKGDKQHTVPTDWQKVYELLLESWGSMYKAVH